MSLGKVKANLGKSLGKLGFCLGLLSNILEFSALNLSTNEKRRLKNENSSNLRKIFKR